MANYKVSGVITDDARIHILKDGDYQGYKDITSGSYEANFELDDATGVAAVAEKSDGEIVGFGDITAVSGSISDITTVGGIKTMQPFVANIASGQTTFNCTLSTSVDMDNCFIIHSGNSSYSGYEYHSFDATTLVLTSSTNVQAIRHKGVNGGTQPICYVRGFAIEFGSGIINSIQRGIITLGSGGPVETVDTAISSVDTTKAFITHSIRMNDYVARLAPPILFLSSATNLRLERYTQFNQALKVVYEVVELV